jgi:Zn-dependent peptidase ImmA (M78 family)/transcriptional regulator with XRE-family HTH domain
MSDGLTGLAALGLEEASPEFREAMAAANATAESGSAAGAGMGARIAAARAARGMTGTRLGELVGLRKDQVSKIESGRRRVDVGELPRFAAALGVTVRHLLGEVDRPALAMAARLAADAGPAAMAPARRRARQLLEIDDLLTQVADLPAARPSKAGGRVFELAGAQFGAMPRSKAAARRQGRQLAELMRHELDLGSDALGDLASLIETHFAVDVSLSPLGTGADGLCVHSGSMALILASTDYPDGHLRFTLAHELGHHLLGDPREVIEEDTSAMFADKAAEWRANAFAGHLLMPERGVNAALEWLDERPGALTERAVVALMEHFGVSRQALVYQLNLLGLLSFDAGQRLQRDRSVAAMVAAHSDVAPTGAATLTRRVHRAPERLARRAISAAQQQRLGLSIVASLLGRDDDEQLWADMMGPVLPDDTTVTRPVPL